MSVQNTYDDFNIERMTVDWLGWGVTYKASVLPVLPLYPL